MSVYIQVLFLFMHLYNVCTLNFVNNLYFAVTLDT